MLHWVTCSFIVNKVVNVYEKLKVKPFSVCAWRLQKLTVHMSHVDHKSILYDKDVQKSLFVYLCRQLSAVMFLNRWMFVVK